MLQSRARRAHVPVVWAGGNPLTSRQTGCVPHVRLFEAAACGTPVISEDWEGLDACFVPGREVLVAKTTEDVLRILRDVTETERRLIGARARARVLGAHTPAHRVAQLEACISEAAALRSRARAS
jgi:spore maturation protein CgeB